MAYNANIPQPTDLLSQSQSDLLANFQALQTLIDVNHVDFASGDQGKHKWCSFPVQGASPATAAAEVAVFSRTSTLTTVPELCIRFAGNGTVTEMTSAFLNVIGWSFLPSGILLKWGGASAGGPGSFTLTYPVAATIPVFNQVFIVLLQAQTASTAFVTAQTAVDFTVTASAAGNWDYLALGF